MRCSKRLGTVVALAVAMVIGCQSGPRLGGLNPFHRSERTTFVTPAEKAQQIRAYADRATGQDTPEQQALVQELVAKLAAENDPLLRQAILETVARFETPLAGKAMLAGLSDDSEFVREASCRLLEQHPTPGATEALAARAHGDDSLDVRIAAARAMGPNGADRQQLLRLLEDRNPAMQLVGVDAMRKATGQDFGGDVAAYIALARGETPAPREDRVEVANRLPDWVPFF